MGNGVWATWAMGYGPQGQWGTGVWGTGGMWHMGNGVQAVWSTRGMGQMGNGVHAMGYRGMGYTGV